MSHAFTPHTRTHTHIHTLLFPSGSQWGDSFINTRWPEVINCGMSDTGAISSAGSAPPDAPDAQEATRQVSVSHSFGLQGRWEKSHRACCCPPADVEPEPFCSLPRCAPDFYFDSPLLPRQPEAISYLRFSISESLPARGVHVGILYSDNPIGERSKRLRDVFLRFLVRFCDKTEQNNSSGSLNCHFILSLRDIEIGLRNMSTA